MPWCPLQEVKIMAATKTKQIENAFDRRSRVAPDLWLERYLSESVGMLRRVREQGHKVLGTCPEGWPYMNVEDLVLLHGRQFEPVPIHGQGVKRGSMGACYMNAGRIALGRPLEFAYCEGYATRRDLEFFPVLHAWLLNRDGKAVDVTWPDGAEYYGVAVCPDYYRWHFEAVQVWDSLLLGSDLGYPLLSGKHSLDSAALNLDVRMARKARKASTSQLARVAT